MATRQGVLKPLMSLIDWRVVKMSIPAEVERQRRRFAVEIYPGFLAEKRRFSPGTIPAKWIRDCPHQTWVQSRLGASIITESDLPRVAEGTVAHALALEKLKTLGARVDVPVFFTLDGGETVVMGKVDAVLDDSVIEIKTKVWGSEHDLIQVAAYAVALGLEKAYIVYRKSVMPVKITPREIRSLRRLFASTKSALQSPTPPPRPLASCITCKYKRLCDAVERGEVKI